MSSEITRLHVVLDDCHQRLERICDDIIEGTKAGVHKGISQGAMSAGRKVLKQTFLQRGVASVLGIEIGSLVDRLSAIKFDRTYLINIRGTLKNGIEDYLDELQTGIIANLGEKLPDVSELSVIIEQRTAVVGEHLRRALPSNCLYDKVVDALQTSLAGEFHKGVEELVGNIRGKAVAAVVEVRKVDRPRKEEKSGSVLRQKVEKDVADMVKKLIEELVENLMDRAAGDLKDKIKGRLQRRLANLSEKKIDEGMARQAELLTRELSKPCADKAGLVATIEESVLPNFTSYLTSLAHSWVPLVAGAAVAAVVLGGTGAVVVPRILNEPPVANIEMMETTGMTVSLSSLASYDPDGEIACCTWEFPDGSSAEGDTILHTFNGPGEYMVALTVDDNRGKQDVTRLPVVIPPPNKPPVAVIGVTRINGLTVYFDGRESHDPENGSLAYLWDFGDGSHSEDPAPVHRYREPGTYPARLTVVDEQEVTGSVETPVSVIPPNEPPVAVIRVEWTEGLAASFNSEASRDPDGRLVSRVWEFGDGRASEAVNPVYEYREPGNYAVRLTVTDDRGASDSVERSVTVNLPNKPPVAVITVTSIDELMVAFSGTASRDPENGPLTYLWDFGDGEPSENPAPVHEYMKQGTYTVYLMVTDAAGGTASAVRTIVLTLETASVTGIQVPSPVENEFGPIAGDGAGTVYVIGRFDGRSNLYRSGDFGVTWQAPRALPFTAAPTVPCLAVSSSPYTLYVSNGIDIWKTTNGGFTWSALPNLFASLFIEPGIYDYGYIVSLDIRQVTDTRYMILAGTTTSGNGRGNVYLYNENQSPVPKWRSMMIDEKHEPGWPGGSADVYDVAFSPNYAIDATICAVAQMGAKYTYFTCLVNPGGMWGAAIPDVRMKTGTGSDISQPRRADIWLPADFNASLLYFRTCFVGIGSLVAAEGDVFKVTAGTAAYDMDIGGTGTGMNVTDVDGSGTLSACRIIAGVDRGNWTPTTLYCMNPASAAPVWSIAKRPPYGTDMGAVARVYVVAHPAFTGNGIALAATGGFDCSVSRSADWGSTWEFAPATAMNVEVQFSVAMNTGMTTELLQLQPAFPYEVIWKSGNTVMVIRPLRPWQTGITYRLFIPKEAETATGSRLAGDVTRNFTFAILY